MKNKKIIIIGITSIIVFSIIFLAYKDYNKSINNIKKEGLKEDFDSVIDNIDKAKK
jgi:hypothetical protein